MKKYTILFLLILLFGSIFAQTFDITNDDSCRAVLSSMPWIKSDSINGTSIRIILYKNNTFKWGNSNGTWGFEKAPFSYSKKVTDSRKIRFKFEPPPRGTSDVQLGGSETVLELVDGCKLFGTPASERNGNINKPSLCAPAGETKLPFCFFQESNTDKSKIEQVQNVNGLNIVPYPNNILPKVKIKLDSLYPHATGIVVDSSRISDTTQRIRINCNCKESLSLVALLFDTTGNLLDKNIYLHSIEDLPDTIKNYIKKNLSSSVRFDNGYLIKNTNNKGEITYSTLMFQRNNRVWERYILKFKSTGEIISKKAVIQRRAADNPKH